MRTVNVMAVIAMKTVATSMLSVISLDSYGIDCDSLSLDKHTLICADFSNDPLGMYNEDEKNEEIGHGYEEGLASERSFIMEDLDSDSLSHGRFLRVLHPKWCLGPHRCGIQMKPKFKHSVEAARLTYRVRIPDNFDFRRGGKLPGLCSLDCSTGCVAVTKGWSVRLMWHSEGDISAYLYTPNKQSICGDNIETGFHLRRGEWSTIELYLKVNDASRNSYKENGVLELTIDGHNVIEITDFVFRENNEGAIDTLLWSNFFGGNDSTWKPHEDTFMDFDSILVTEIPSDKLSASLFGIIASIFILIVLVIGWFCVCWRYRHKVLHHKRRNSDAMIPTNRG